MLIAQRPLLFLLAGAEYVIMRHLIMRGQACRFRYIEFEGHALYNEAHVAFRMFDVLLPWLLHGCERPQGRVKLNRYYGTPTSLPREHRIDHWAKRKDATNWCEHCPLLDRVVDVNLGLV